MLHHPTDDRRKVRVGLGNIKFFMRRPVQHEPQTIDYSPFQMISRDLRHGTASAFAISPSPDMPNVQTQIAPLTIWRQEFANRGVNLYYNICGFLNAICLPRAMA
jgi:hypothetical protein